MDFSPSIYEHAARLIERSPFEVSTTPELMLEAHAKAYETYRHSPVVVGIDIYNLEAEAYGAGISQPSGNDIPAVSSHPCGTMDEIIRLPLLDPLAAGRIPMVIEVARKIKLRYPEADIRIPVSGPFSLASNLVGFDTLLCDVLTDPDAARAALEHLVDGQLVFCSSVSDAELDIAFFESAATPPLMAPESFESVLLPSLKRMLTGAGDIIGRAIPCVIGGNTLPVLDYILATGTGYVICPSETDQPAFMAAMEKRADVMVRINTNPKVMTGTNLAEVYTELDRVMELASGRQNVCIGTGALPYEAIPETVLAAREYVTRADP